MSLKQLFSCDILTEHNLELAMNLISLSLPLNEFVKWGWVSGGVGAMANPDVIMKLNLSIPGSVG